MMKAVVVAMVLLAMLAAAASAERQRATFVGAPPRGGDWQRTGRSAADAEHEVIIAVKLRADAAAQCDTLVNELVAPGSDRTPFKHDQVGHLLSDFIATRKVEQWVRGHAGLKAATAINGDWIRVSGSVANLEKLLGGAAFHDWESAAAGRTIRRTPNFSLPAEVSEAIDFIGNTVHFPTFKAQYAMVTPYTGRPNANGNIAPDDIFTLYKIKNATVTSTTTQSVFEALGQDFAPADLTQFQTQFNLKQQAVDKVIGPNDPTQCAGNPNNCAEANLDVQYMMAMAQGAVTTFWSIPTSSQDPFLDWIVTLANTTNPPLVHSISYGSIASEDQSGDITRFNTEACKLALQGVTIMVASGDDGVANFQARSDPSQCGFNPSFPATIAYATTVGATQGPENGTPEIACSSATNGLITTGGGFSLYILRPAFQNDVVKNYLATAPNLPPLTMFNSKGRAYPDVSIIGHNYQVVIAGQTYLLSGTSASSPVFAGMISHINSVRGTLKKGPLGYINPALYAAAAVKGQTVFNDITSGENNCCAGQPGQQVCCQYGFTATTGWDPLTGLGSPDFPSLLAALSKV